MAHRQSAPFGAHYFEDPSIRQVAALEYDRLWERISFKTRNGVWFYRAREVVLAEEMIDVRKAFGDVVASRVTYAIQHTDPQLAPAPSFDKARNARECAEALMMVRGRISFMNRLWLRWFGTIFW